MLSRHVAVVESYGVGGLSEGGYGSGGVELVSLEDVGEDVVEVGVLAFGSHFVEASLCSYFGSCGHEYFEVGVWEYGGADVTSVHYDALLAADASLPLGELGSHGGYGGYGADVLADGHVAYLVFDVLAVEEGGVACFLWVEVEGYVE